MKRILLVIDALNPDAQALDFVCYLGRLTNSVITGVFLDNLVADERLSLKTMHGNLFLEWDVDKYSPEQRQKSSIIDQNISVFRETCGKKSVRCSVHRNNGVPASEIISGSRYADIIVADAATSFDKTEVGTPTAFIRDVLKDAECPVIIAPESFNTVDELIFAYDGTQSAAFSIKQFTYLFPEFTDRKATVLQVNKEGEWQGDDRKSFGDWIQNHYSKIGFEVLKGNTDDRLFNYLSKKNNIFLVMGSYGRTDLSNLFNSSQADLLINTIIQPIFIAHP